MNKPQISSLTIIRLHFPWDLTLVTLGGGALFGWVVFSSDMSDGYAQTRLKIIDPILKHPDLVISCPNLLFWVHFVHLCKNPRWDPLGFSFIWLDLTRSTSLNYLWYNLNQVGLFPTFTKPPQLGPNLYITLIPQIQSYPLIISPLLSIAKTQECIEQVRQPSQASRDSPLNILQIDLKRQEPVWCDNYPLSVADEAFAVSSVSYLTSTFPDRISQMGGYTLCDNRYTFIKVMIRGFN